ncbi:MAG: hypothetical protein HOF01_03390 [Chloroflexi bacterium]|nr:hypothetical protein [Chloroflexota bacterium]
MPTDTIVESKEIQVTYVAGNSARSIAEQAPKAVDELELAIPTLVGNKFYGIVVEGEYRACVKIDEFSDSEFVDSLPKFEIPGGRYVHRRLVDWNHNVELLVETVEELTSRADHDPSRFVIEYYRSHTEVVIRVPVT